MTEETKKQVLIKQRALIAHVSSLCGYPKYQVEDVLSALSLAITENLLMNNRVTLEGVGTFSPQKPSLRKFKSILTGVEIEKYTKRSSSFRPDSYLSNALNSVDAKDALNPALNITKEENHE